MIALEEQTLHQTYSRRFVRFTNALFFSVVAVYCLWVLTLPVFPSQDGGVHLYYTNVLSHLLAGSQSYTKYFYIRTPIPPYALHYYLLLFLTKLSNPVMAEKLVVVIIIAGFSIGFRFMARVITKQGDLIALWSLPFALSWMLGMGFHNYCLSMALGLWGFGFWLRGNQRGGWTDRVIFVSLAIVMLLTHPVPLCMMLIMVWGDILLRLVQGRFEKSSLMNGGRGVISQLGPDLFWALLASSTLAYIGLFIDTNRSAENVHDTYLNIATLRDLIRLKPLSLISGNLAARLLRMGYYAILAVSLLYAGRGSWQRLRTRRLQTADLFFAAAIALIFFVPLLPRSINGADYFSDRLLIYIWIFALAAASANVKWGRTVRITSNVGACVFALLALFLADHYIRPVATRVASIENVPVSLKGSPGLYIDAVDTPSHDALTFDPFIWAAMRYFRRADAIILDAPWLDLRTMPVGSTRELLTHDIPPQILNYPEKFRKLVFASAPLRARIGSAIRMIVFVGYPRNRADHIDTLVAKFTNIASCHVSDWYSVCGVNQPSSSSLSRLRPK